MDALWTSMDTFMLFYDFFQVLKSWLYLQIQIYWLQLNGYLLLVYQPFYATGVGGQREHPWPEINLWFHWWWMTWCSAIHPCLYRVWGVSYLVGKVKPPCWKALKKPGTSWGNRQILLEIKTQLYNYLVYYTFWYSWIQGCCQNKSRYIYIYIYIYARMHAYIYVLTNACLLMLVGLNASVESLWSSSYKINYKFNSKDLIYSVINKWKDSSNSLNGKASIALKISHDHCTLNPPRMGTTVFK